MGQPGGPEFHGHPGHPAPPQGHPQGAPPPGHPQQPHQPMSNWFEPMWNFRVKTKFWLEIFTPSFNFFPFFSLLINCTLRNVTYVEKLPFEYTKKKHDFPTQVLPLFIPGAIQKIVFLKLSKSWIKIKIFEIKSLVSFIFNNLKWRTPYGMSIQNILKWIFDEHSYD